NAISAAFESITNCYTEIHKCELHSEPAFVDAVAELAHTDDALLIISDRFTAPMPGDGGERYDLAKLVRERSCDGRGVVALLALADPPLRRIGLVDSVVERGADQKAIGEAIEGALRAIRYKLPPEKRSFTTDIPEIEVRVVSHAGELRECFALRYAVYKLLGYFYESPEREPARLEL